jgi:hypothetical protein
VSSCRIGELASAHPGRAVVAGCYGAKGLRNAPAEARRRRTERFEQIRNLVERGMSREQVAEPIGTSGKQKKDLELVPTAALVTCYST